MDVECESGGRKNGDFPGDWRFPRTYRYYRKVTGEPSSLALKVSPHHWQCPQDQSGSRSPLPSQAGVYTCLPNSCYLATVHVHTIRNHMDFFFFFRLFQNLQTCMEPNSAPWLLWRKLDCFRLSQPQPAASVLLPYSKSVVRLPDRGSKRGSSRENPTFRKAEYKLSGKGFPCWLSTLA
ncbi:uncharacterized protein BDV17DRAFT_170009 [Aspergillus undulatus]|uniref:uncharacterized protein n=1 Tax=Aspergillus undulatus TaxID=1810928 RepID=UPI003CCCD802